MSFRDIQEQIRQNVGTLSPYLIKTVLGPEYKGITPKDKKGMLYCQTQKLCCAIMREKGRDLTQSYDKRPYTHRKIQKATWQHKKRHHKCRLHNDCRPTYDGQLE